MNTTKLLGFYIGTDLTTQLMSQHLDDILERLQKAKLQHYTMVTRVGIVNQLVTCALLFMTQLWIGDLSQLHEMDSQISQSIWSGKEDKCRPRVDLATIHRSKKDGGLAVISVKDQTIALAGKLILQACQDGEDTLQCIVWEKVVNLSERKWGRRDYT